jgi:hypothetical protein
MAALPTTRRAIREAEPPRPMRLLKGFIVILLAAHERAAVRRGGWVDLR